MNTAFNYIKNLGCLLPAPVASNVCIPFRYATDGCSLATGCCAKWGYHVAVLVSVDNGVSCVDRAFDPSLFNFSRFYLLYLDENIS
jgi:hypothetical protein